MKILITLSFALISASVMARGPRLASLCESLSKMKLPGQCKAVCNKSAGGEGGTNYTIVISQNKFVVSSPEISEQYYSEAERTATEMTITAEHGDYSLIVKVNPRNEITYIKNNEIECK